MAQVFNLKNAQGLAYFIFPIVKCPLNRLGEIRDLTFEGQRHRASGLNLVTAAIMLWNTVYMDRAVVALHQSGHPIDDALLPHVAPVHWNHINLTGDYSWRQNKRVEKGRFRPLRMSRP